MAVLLPNGKQYYIDTSTGLPLVGGKVYTYAAGTSTPKATYTTAAGTVSNANPVILDSRGEATIFWDGAYKIVIKDASDNLIWEVDNVDTSTDASDVSYNGVSISTIFGANTAHVVETISDLSAVSSSDWSFCLVAGYYAAGDGGGGYYYYDSTDTTSSQNGGTIIVASDGARWKLLHNGSVTAKQFGAIDDGYTTDATSYIQAGINALDSGSLVIDGAFKIDSAITLANGVGLVGLNEYTGMRYDGAYTSANYKSVLALSDTAYIQTAEQDISKCLIINQRYTAIGSFPPPLTLANTAAAYAAFAGTAIKCESQATLSNKILESPKVSDCTIIGFEYLLNSAINGPAVFENCYIDCKNGAYTDQGGLVEHGVVFENCVLDFILNKRGANGSFTAVTPTGYGVKTEGIATISNTIILRHDKSLVAVGAVGARAIVSNSNLSGGTYGIDAGVGSFIYVTNSAVGDVISSATKFSFVGGGVGDIENNAGYMFLAGVTKGTVTGTASANVEQYFPLAAHTPTTFTPVLKFGGVDTGITYSVQAGSYVRQDNVVNGTIHILLTSKGAATGDATISLPFTQSAVAGCYGSGVVLRHSDLNATGGDIAGFITTSSDTMKISINDATATPTTTTFMTDAKFQNDTLLIINFTMFIDR